MEFENFLLSLPNICYNLQALPPENVQFPISELLMMIYVAIFYISTNEEVNYVCGNSLVPDEMQGRELNKPWL